MHACRLRAALSCMHDLVRALQARRWRSVRLDVAVAGGAVRRAAHRARPGHRVMRSRIEHVARAAEEPQVAVAARRLCDGDAANRRDAIRRHHILLQRVDIIPAAIIEVIKAQIAERSPVLMGASRRPLVKNSVGETLYRDYGFSPQAMSYVLPLLVEAGFCTVSPRRPFLIRVCKYEPVGTAGAG